MILVHATKASINGYKVRLFLAMLRVPYELVELDMYGGEHKREPFLSLNPFGQMPALQDGAFSIADSHACLVYLARKYDSSGRSIVHIDLAFPLNADPTIDNGQLIIETKGSF